MIYRIKRNHVENLIILNSKSRFCDRYNNQKFQKLEKLQEGEYHKILGILEVFLYKL